MESPHWPLLPDDGEDRDGCEGWWQVNGAGEGMAGAWQGCRELTSKAGGVYD